MKRHPLFWVARSTLCVRAFTGRVTSYASGLPRAPLIRLSLTPWRVNMNSYPTDQEASGNQMPCAGLGEALSAYLDNELDTDTRQLVENHLQTCLRCSTEVAELRQVKRFLAPGSPFAPPLPANLSQRVRSHTYESAPRGATVRVRVGYVAGRS